MESHSNWFWMLESQMIFVSSKYQQLILNEWWFLCSAVMKNKEEVPKDITESFIGLK